MNKLPNNNSPLAVRMRPEKIEEFIGQEHILGEGKVLANILKKKKILPALIFYGPPGTGKTSLGFIIANSLSAEFVYLNAAFSSVGQVKKELEQAYKRRQKGKNTLLFIDEIHRFNKLQQEILIPDTEQGTIFFIGATVYNPRYYLIRSLISRCLILNFEKLADKDIEILVQRALVDEKRGLGREKLQITNKALNFIIKQAEGDGRRALMCLELAALNIDEKNKKVIDLKLVKQIMRKTIFYDPQGTYHYDTISAFIKSIRGSDPDSALYWLARMIVSGEDPRFIARRLVILASEDISNADPQALILANSCFSAVESVGMPEAQIILAQVTVYLACAPKSNTTYQALMRAISDVEKAKEISVPDHIKTHSPDYKYPHDYYSSEDNLTGGYVKQFYGASRQYYFPRPVGYEEKINKFLEIIRKKKGKSV